jgi:hypothetical protein
MARFGSLVRRPGLLLEVETAPSSSHFRALAEAPQIDERLDAPGGAKTHNLESQEGFCLSPRPSIPKTARDFQDTATSRVRSSGPAQHNLCWNVSGVSLGPGLAHYEPGRDAPESCLRRQPMASLTPPPAPRAFPTTSARGSRSRSPSRPRCPRGGCLTRLRYHVRPRSLGCARARASLSALVSTRV